MQKKLENRQDIETLVDAFYLVARRDPDIGYLFDYIPAQRWPHHLDKIYRFWATVLLGEESYEGNPMLKHIRLDQRLPLTERHFDVWLQHWEQTVRSLFVGEMAENAIFRGQSIKALMQERILGDGLPHFIGKSR